MGSWSGGLGRMLFIPNRWTSGRGHGGSLRGTRSDGIQGDGGVLDGVEIPSWRLGLEFLGEEVPRLWTAAF